MEHMLQRSEIDHTYMMPILKMADPQNFDQGDHLYIRYAIARWGYSTSIMAWDTNKENANFPTVDMEYYAYLAKLDPYHHLITASHGNHMSVLNPNLFHTIMA